MLVAPIEGLRRPISFRRLLDNLKNVPQAEYLMKAGLPVLAAENIYDSGARSLRELTGLGKFFLPVMRECQASFREIQTVAALKSPKPEDLRQLCALRLDGERAVSLWRVIKRLNSGSWSGWMIRMSGC